MNTFDYIIVGAGTAGCLLANRLSAETHKRVLLIEAGGKDDYHWVHIPVGYLYCIGNPRADWCYQTEASAGLNGRKLKYPRGKILGGCSSINGMIYMRGQARDYDSWADQLGDAQWRWDNCLPDFVRHEDHHAGPSAMHGAGGEWKVAKQRLHWPILDAFAQAASEAGIAPTNDFNTGNNAGVGYFEVNQKNGWRWNTAKAFLRPTCFGRSNFEMWSNAQVAKLLLEKDEAGQTVCTGVQVWNGHEMVIAKAIDEVILSAGSIGSPQILELSGIGQAERLHSLGITPMADLAGVGENLQDHLQIRSVYQVQNAKTLNTMVNSWLGKIKIAAEYGLRRTGPMSMAPSQLGAFAKSDASLAWPNLEYHVQPLSLDAFGEPLHSFPAITASVCNLNPTSRGSTHIKTPKFADAPAIAPNYLSTNVDRQVAAQSLRLTRRIMQQPAMRAHAPEEIKPGVQYQSDEDLIKLAGDIATTIFHPVGSTKMGAADDASAVLDARFRVRGVARLRVVDAGAMPTITSGNTNSPTLMMAEKAARWLREDNGA